MDLIVENPSIIQQIIPFFTSNEDQDNISWNHEDMFLWASFQGHELNIKYFYNTENPTNFFYNIVKCILND